MSGQSRERAVSSGWNCPRHPQVRACLRELRAEGFEIGFHPSYRTLGDPELMAVEKARVEEAVGAVCQGGRQHYLRFRVPETWRQWERLGLTYDSTMTFAGHEGFRCGTCHAYRPFDLEQNRSSRSGSGPSSSWTGRCANIAV